jgi:AcrR family transcriptional regulator
MPKVLPEYKDLVKSKIIDAALNIFALKGFYGSTMLDIARKIGISKATLYFYFKSKEDLLRMISITIYQTLGEIFRSSFEGDDFDAAAGKIHDRVVDDVLPQLPVGLEILSLASRDEQVKTMVQKDRETGLDAIQAALQHQMDKGLVTNAVDARVLAQLVLGLCWDMMMQHLIGQDRLLVRDAWIESLSTVLK